MFFIHIVQIKISSPNPKKINNKVISTFLNKNYFSSDEWTKFVKKQNNPKYKSWKEIQRSLTIPLKLRPEEAFKLLNIDRRASAKQTPICDKQGVPFVWEELSRFRFFCDDFAKNFGAYKTKNTLSDEKKDLQRKKIFEGTVEEAIASSQMEGAIITRKQGRELLRSKRKPKTNAEIMVFNNYRTIIRIENEWKHEKMSESLLIRIQESLTKNTLEKPQHEGQLRKDADNIVVGDKLQDRTAFVPPTEKQMKKQLIRLIDFANDELAHDEYFGDLPKAILLHFWIAYLHPFCDGNGRTARAIFYWYLLRNNYPYIGFLPISTRIKKSKNSYEQAFLLVEQDNNNLTYFFDYIIRQMKISIKDFQEYEERLEQEEQKNIEISKKCSNLNDRQIELLQYFLQHPNEYTTFGRHQSYQEVSHVTARKDLLALEEKNYLSSRKKGKHIFFSPTKKVQTLL